MSEYVIIFKIIGTVALVSGLLTFIGMKIAEYID